MMKLFAFFFIVILAFVLASAFPEKLINAVHDKDPHFRNECRYADAMYNEYKEFFKISDLDGVNRTGYIAHFPFHVKSERDAHVLFTTGPKAIKTDSEYEIVFGLGGTQTVIRRKQQSKTPLATAQHPKNVISGQKWTEFLIQITTSGDIKLFRKEDDNSFRLILGVNDQSSLPVNYISFGSFGKTRAEFYFNCPFNVNTPDMIHSNETGCTQTSASSHFRYLIGYLI